VASRPWRLGAQEAIDSLAAFLDGPSFAETWAGFTGYVAPATAADEVPVTVVWGSRDRLLLPRQARRAQRLLPRARHVMVPGAGHLLMLDDPQASAAAILATTGRGLDRLAE
jgi:pimeloyl-ACP methyl ester carboxylesterase